MSNLFYGMASESEIESFAAAFLQIHLASVLSATIMHGLSGILYGLATYLISLHILAAATYLLDVRNGRVLKAIFQRLKQKLRPEDRKNHFKVGNGLSGI